MHQIEAFYERRRDLQIRGESIGKGDECWERLGIANRLLQRISNRMIAMSPGIERDITRCFEHVDRWLTAANPPTAEARE